MRKFLRKKVWPVLTAGLFVVALSGAALLLTGCPDEPDPMMDPPPAVPREDPPEAPDNDEPGEQDVDDLLDF